MTERRAGFTGRARRLENRWRVRATDFAARWIITIGGIGTIVAVLLVLAFLISVVLPLFWPPASLTRSSDSPIAVAGQPLAVGVDEYQLLTWSVDGSGTLRVKRLDTGESLAETRLFEEPTQVTSVSLSETGADVAVGLADGTVSLGRLGIAAEFVARDQVPPEWRSLRPGETLAADETLIERTAQGEWRTHRVDVQLEAPWRVSERPIERIDYLPPSAEGGRSEGALAAWTDGKSYLMTVRRNELTGGLRQDELHALPVPAGWSEPPRGVFLTSQADNLFLASVTGQVARIAIRDPAKAEVVEQVPVVDQGRRLSWCQWILGRESLLCGDDAGNLRVWFRVPMAEGGGRDGQTLALVRTLAAAAGDTGAIHAGGSSQRSRLVAAGGDAGRVAIYHATSGALVAEHHLPTERPLQGVQFAPKENGVLAWDGNQLWRLNFDARHADISWSSLFGAVWYEGREGPAHIWQSSSAGVDSEPKFGLLPLVFGTLKATFYSMLFGAPIALLAAVYASEFMQPKLRAKVKPTIELMASLPSVVLGFLAALVMAPFIENHLASLLAAGLVVPTALLLGAQLWQLMPSNVAMYAAPFRLIAISLTFLAGVWGGAGLGPWLEQVLFDGHLLRWLDGQRGSATGGWFILWLPVVGVGTALLCGMVVNPWLRDRWGGLARERFAALNLAKFLVVTLVAIGVTWGLASALNSAGFDPRGQFVGTYVQRNSLIVGFVMGFAIIPLIFTIADDALNTVPHHLRSASLGAGATPWQTAIRVVIPTAMSGLFSAVMIGLGRAVGETMIVLMAGGNTPIMDWNLFNGFRTLSANIAVELPEAVRGSSHYRTLFLAALTLFLLTFVVNTAAEWVRLRFRKRAYQL